MLNVREASVLRLIWHILDSSLSLRMTKTNKLVMLNAVKHLIYILYSVY